MSNKITYESWQERLHTVLCSWHGTPYGAGQCRKRVGVDCVQFVNAVLQELHRMPREPLPALPQDLSLHQPAGAYRAMHDILKQFPHVAATQPYESGDVLIYKRGQGPGHVLIIGRDPATAWHADAGPGVCITSASDMLPDIMAAWRATGRASW